MTVNPYPWNEDVPTKVERKSLAEIISKEAQNRIERLESREDFLQTVATQLWEMLEERGEMPELSVEVRKWRREK